MNSMAIPFTPPVNPTHHHHHQRAPVVEVDYQRMLNDIVMELDMDLPAVTAMVDKDKKLKRPSYLAKVKIGDKTWTSHPVICGTSQDAENEAIQKALKDLTAKRDLLKAGRNLAIKEDEKKMIIDNVIQIISEQQGGAKLMLHTAVAVEYAQKYKTPLPKNWIEFLAEGGQLTVERQQFNKDIVLIGLTKKQSQPGVRSQGAIRRPQALTQIKPDSNSLNIVNDSNVIMKPSVEVDVLKSGKPIPDAYLPKVVPNPQNNDDYFDIFVVFAATPSNFYVQSLNCVLNHSPFKKMVTEMQDLYNNDENKIELNSDVLEVGLFVAAHHADLWSRARIHSVMGKDSSQVMCLFVDYGELHMVDLANVQPLYSQFRSLPRQAIKAALANIEPVHGDWDVMATFEFSKMVDGRTFVASVHAISYEEDAAGNKKPVLKLSLCDTSDETDVFIEQILIEKNFARRSV